VIILYQLEYVHIWIILRLPAQNIRGIIIAIEKRLPILSIKFICLSVGILALTHLGCFSDASRDNPLDPANGIYVSGIVKRLYSNDGLSNAQIRLNPGNKITISDKNGNYRFSGVSPGLYEVMVSAEGFSKDTTEINLTNNTQVNFALDSLPYLKKINVTTSHITHWFPPDDIYSMLLETTGYDGDGSGDIKNVWYQIEEINFSDTLQRTAPGGNIFRGQAVVLDLPVFNLQELIGKPFKFFIADLPGNTTESPPHFISRIIEETPQLSSPVGLTIISSSQIIFKWQAITNIHFPYTQKIEIYSIGLGLKVDEINNINSDLSDFTYNSSLSNGDYYWVLYIVDEFGNNSGSKEGSFRVQI
jgi:Carboxypeptidase regulatory-like domain